MSCHHNPKFIGGDPDIFYKIQLTIGCPLQLMSGKLLQLKLKVDWQTRQTEGTVFEVWDTVPLFTMTLQAYLIVWLLYLCLIIKNAELNLLEFVMWFLLGVSMSGVHASYYMYIRSHEGDLPQITYMAECFFHERGTWWL